MIHYLLRLMMILSGLFALPVLLIRAQPYDDSDLRAFLTPPEGCPAPCFMGIRPDVTTAEEALALLETHEWVQNIENQNFLQNNINASTGIIWEWNNSASKWIRKNSLSFLTIEQNRVKIVSISANIRLGDILLALGRPDKFLVYRFDNPDSTIITFVVLYLDKGIVITSLGICPFDAYYVVPPLVITSNLQEPDGVETTRMAC